MIQDDLGVCSWTTDWPTHKLIHHLGPEPLTNTFSVDYLYALSRARNTSIKQLIMDSRVVVGVGNIYANEALFLSRIHPKRAANRISKKRLGALVDNIRDVLSKAISLGGSPCEILLAVTAIPVILSNSSLFTAGKGRPVNAAQMN